MVTALFAQLFARAPRVHAAPGLPCALAFEEGEEASKTRAQRAARMRWRGSRQSCAEFDALRQYSAVVARLDPAIQYAAASRLKHWRLWNTGSPAFAGDDRERGEPPRRAGDDPRVYIRTSHRQPMPVVNA